MFFLTFCDKSNDLLKCGNLKKSFYGPTLEDHLGDSLNLFEIKKTDKLSFRLDDNVCREDSCSYYIFNLSEYGIHNDSMISFQHYIRTKKWDENDVIVKCDFIKKFEALDGKSSGYFKFFSHGDCPVLIKNQIDSCSYQKSILHIDSVIYFERIF